MGIFLLILAIIAFIGAIVAFFVAGTYNSGERAAPIVTSIVLIGVGILFLLGSSFRMVNYTEVGVPVAFGQVGSPAKSGVNFVAPWVDIETYPTRPVLVELKEGNSVVARTADAGQVTVQISTNWKVDPDKAASLYGYVRTGDDQAISENLITRNLKQAVNATYNATRNLDINNTTKAAADIKTNLEEQLKKYGILIEDINIISAEPDPKTAANIALYAAQQQATRIAEEAKKTATIEAERKYIEAQGLQRASEVLAGISQKSAEILCMQLWQQTNAKAIDAQEPLYTSPCGNSGSLIVNTPTKQ